MRRASMTRLGSGGMVFGATAGGMARYSSYSNIDPTSISKDILDRRGAWVSTGSREVLQSPGPLNRPDPKAGHRHQQDPLSAGTWRQGVAQGAVKVSSGSKDQGNMSFWASLFTVSVTSMI